MKDECQHLPEYVVLKNIVEHRKEGSTELNGVKIMEHCCDMEEIREVVRVCLKCGLIMGRAEVHN